MRVLRAPNLARAHELAVQMILEKGWQLETEDEEATIEYDTIAMQVDTPLASPMVSSRSRFGKKFMENYARDLIYGTDAVFEYDYHGRLFSWGEKLVSAGRPVTVDQVDYIIRKLAASPVTRRAIAITWNPVIDEQLDDCPCLQLIQCIIRDDTLRMKVVFRSNDILTAAGANMYALVSLQNHIAGALGVACGPYTHISLVPHIYYLRDLDDIEPFCARGECIRPIPGVCQVCGKCRCSRPE